MISTPPRPDDPGESGAWEVVGSAGRGAVGPDEVDRAARTYWEAEADAYQAEHGAFLAGARQVAAAGGVPAGLDGQAGTTGGPPGTTGGQAGFVWGPEGLAEEDAGLLGPVAELAGLRILEVGCGAAQCSAWLAQRGVRAIGIDIAVNQLRHSSGRPSSSPGMCHPNGHLVTAGMTQAGEPVGARGAGTLAVAAASATALPFRAASFDAAFASYGAIQFVADLPRLLAEVRRVLRPGARWVFSVTHPVRWAFPDDPGPAGLSVSGSYFDRAPYVERDETGAAVYAEFHRTTGEYVAALRMAGFAIEHLLEPEWPEWNDATWGGWSPLRGRHLPGTLILGCRAS